MSPSRAPSCRAGRGARFGRAARAACVAACMLAGLGSCAGGPIEGGEPMATRDVRVVGAHRPAPRASARGYVFVARRARAVVALAEARGIEEGQARAAIERLGDALDACIAARARDGKGLAGAARVVAQLDPNGNIAGATLRADPGYDVASTAAICLMVPFERLAFGPTDAAVRGIAIEALWDSRGTPP